MILAIPITSQIVNLEFENKTQLLAYSSKRGRKLILDKLLASIVMCLGVTTVLIGATLAVYFCIAALLTFAVICPHRICRSDRRCRRASIDIMAARKKT